MKLTIIGIILVSGLIHSSQCKHIPDPKEVENTRFLTVEDSTSGQQITRQMIYMWMLIIKEKIEWIDSTGGYQPILYSYGIKLKEIYQHMKEWKVIVDKYCSFAEMMNSKELIDICCHLQYLPGKVEIIDLYNDKKRDQKVTQSIEQVKGSNTKPFNLALFTGTTKGETCKKLREAAEKKKET